MTERLFSIHCFSLCCLLVAASHFRFAQLLYFSSAPFAASWSSRVSAVVANQTETGSSWAARLRDISRGIDAFPYVIDFFDACQDFSPFREFFRPMSSLCGIRLISITLHRVRELWNPSPRKLRKMGRSRFGCQDRLEASLHRTVNRRRIQITSDTIYRFPGGRQACP